MSKNIIRLILILFVVGSVTYLIVSDDFRLKSEIKENTLQRKITDKNKEKTERVVVYYFHGNRRCITCRTIERYIVEALEENFRNNIENGQLTLNVINVEKRENRHFIYDYNLTSSTSVLTLMDQDKQQKWKKLDLVWKLVRDKPAFFHYIKSETNKYLRSTNE